MQGHLVRDDLFGRVVLTTAMLQPDLVRSYALDPKWRHFLPEDGAEPLNDGVTRQRYLFNGSRTPPGISTPLLIPSAPNHHTDG